MFWPAPPPPEDVFIYAGGSRVAARNASIFHFDPEGNEITSGNWPLDHGTTDPYGHGAQVWGVAVGLTGNVYIGGQRNSGNITTRKYSSDGTLLWSADNGSHGPSWHQGVLGIHIDSSENVYTVGGPMLRKYNANGTLLWSFDHGTMAGNPALLRCVTTDSAGNVYVAGDRSLKGGYGLGEGPPGGPQMFYPSVRKFSSSGVEVANRGVGTGTWHAGGWPHDTRYRVHAIDIDPLGGFVYVGGSGSAGNPSRQQKYDLQGNELTLSDAAMNHGAPVRALRVGDDGSWYVGGDSSPWYPGGGSANDIVLRKITSAGAHVTTGGWPISSGLGRVYGLALSPQGNIYACGQDSSGAPTLRQYNPSGFEVTANNWPIAYGIAVTYSVAIRQVY